MLARKNSDARGQEWTLCERAPERNASGSPIDKVSCKEGSALLFSWTIGGLLAKNCPIAANCIYQVPAETHVNVSAMFALVLASLLTA